MSPEVVRMGSVGSLVWIALLAACTAATPPTTPTPSVSPSAVASPAVSESAGLPGGTSAPTASPYVMGLGTVISGASLCHTTTAGTTTTDEAGNHGRDILMECTNQTNDPRVNGTETLTFNYDVWGSSMSAIGVQWGSTRIENEGGTWDGNWSGVIFPRLQDEITIWYAGGGGYEGLTYFAHIVGSQGRYAVEGLIFQGVAPER